MVGEISRYAPIALKKPKTKKRKTKGKEKQKENKFCTKN